MKIFFTRKRKDAEIFKAGGRNRKCVLLVASCLVPRLCVSALKLFLVLFAALGSQAQTYNNPVIPGDFPDPSVIRVGEDFYATATTGGWAPHFPLLHSKDLINWKIIGAIFTEKPTWAKGDFWAPEITEDKGRFFVYYTARRDEGKNKKGTLCVAVAVSDKPTGPYTDKGALVCQEMGSIDGFFIRDETGKPFLIWKEDGNDRGQPTWLYAQQLDESGTKLLGKPKKMFRNDAAWENHVVEGSYIIRRNGWFYHFYSGNACCGRGCNYALGVARSRTLLGEWEKNPANPILAANDTWQCPGHGSIVTTADGRDFLLYHAYRKRSDAFNIGREALLDEIKWRDGWATINNGRGASRQAAVPLGGARQQKIPVLSDEFNANVLDPRWTRPLSVNARVILQGGLLKIAPTETQLAADKMPEALVAERTVSGDYVATARIDFSELKEEEFAGISAYSWRGAAIGASVGGGKIFAWRREGGKQEETASVVLPPNAKQIYLRVQAAGGELYSFSYSADEKNWMTLGAPVAGSHVEGARIALIYSGKTTDASARFDWLRVEQK